MIEGVQTQYYRYPRALELTNDVLKPPRILIAVLEPNDARQNNGLLSGLQQTLHAFRLQDWIQQKALKAAEEYRGKERLQPPGCKECPIHQLATLREVLRVCGGLDVAKVTHTHSPSVITDGDGITIRRTVYACGGHGSLGLEKRQRARLDPDTLSSLDEQIALLPQASCVLLPELI